MHEPRQSRITGQAYVRFIKKGMSMKAIKNTTDLFIDYSQGEYSETFCFNIDSHGFHTDVIDEIEYNIHPRGIALISTQPGVVDYIGTFKRNSKVASKKSRLKIENIKAFPNPIQIWEVLPSDNKNVQELKSHIERSIISIIPYMVWNMIMDHIRKDDDSFNIIRVVYSKLMNFSKTSNEKSEENNGFQKDALTFILKCSGFDDLVINLNEYDIENDAMPQFLRTLRRPSFREDVMIINDSTVFDDWRMIDKNLVCTTLSDGNKRLSIMYSNRLKLEEMLGVDLIYIDEQNKTMILIQYKRLIGKSVKQYNPLKDKNYRKEMDTINKINSLLNLSRDSNYRYNKCCFYFKLCKDIQPVKSRELVDGMYIPLDYWQYLLDSSLTDNGYFFSYESVPNHINNTLFTGLLKTGLIGCSEQDYSILGEIIKEIIDSGKSLLLAKLENLTIALT